MKGTFKSQQDCKDELINQGFKFYSINEGRLVYISANELAEIYVYSDSSASALIGRIN